jgi:hypothetical protein
VTYTYNEIVKLCNRTVVLNSDFPFLLLCCFIFACCFLYCCFCSLLLSVEVIHFVCFLFSYWCVLVLRFLLFLRCLTLYCGSRLWFESTMAPSAITSLYYNDTLCFPLPWLWFLDFVPCPLFWWKLENWTFRKVDLFSSSGMGVRVILFSAILKHESESGSRVFGQCVVSVPRATARCAVLMFRL